MLTGSSGHRAKKVTRFHVWTVVVRLHACNSTMTFTPSFNSLYFCTDNLSEHLFYLKLPRKYSWCFVWADKPTAGSQTKDFRGCLRQRCYFIIMQPQKALSWRETRRPTCRSWKLAELFSRSVKPRNKIFRRNTKKALYFTYPPSRLLYTDCKQI
jgi:hypothetical protein